MTTATPRVVSLIASATEIVHALGAGDQLIGRSHECDYPPTVSALPALTAPKFNPHADSEGINERVLDILQRAMSVYRIDTDALKALAPDVILTQTQCAICAVSLPDVEQAVCDWLEMPAQIVSLEANALDAAIDDIQRVAEALGVPERGASLVEQSCARMDAIAERSRDLPRPRVATVEWIAPLMAAGNWVPELIERAGGMNLFGKAGEHSPWMTWEDLRLSDPDVIVVMPCGFDVARSREEMPALTAQPGWADLRAVREGQVYLTDGNQYFNRPGPRLVESLEILAEILHPDAFDFGHHGSGWERFAPR